MGLTDESADGSRAPERAGAATWLLIFDWTAGAATVFEVSRGLGSFDEMPPATAAGGSPWGLTSGDAGLASVDAESARRTRTMYDVSIWISAPRRRGVRWGVGIVLFHGA